MTDFLLSKEEDARAADTVGYSTSSAESVDLLQWETDARCRRPMGRFGRPGFSAAASVRSTAITGSVDRASTSSIVASTRGWRRWTRYPAVRPQMSDGAISQAAWLGEAGRLP